MKTYKRNKRNCPIGQGYSCCLDHYDDDRRVAGADQIPADTHNGLASAPTAAHDQASETGAPASPTASALPGL